MDRPRCARGSRAVRHRALAGGPGGGQAPGIDTEECEGCLGLLGYRVLPAIYPVVDVGDGFRAGRGLVAEPQSDFASEVD